jgi:SNF2 family DNA or RNA helicase
MPDIFRKIGIEEVLEGFGWDRNSNSTTLNSSAISINQLRAMLAPFVLRRLKSDVLDQLVDKVQILHLTQISLTHVSLPHILS